MWEGVRAVERALDILLCFSQEEPVLSLTQIARRLEMSKSTAHRLLGTLENKRFVARDATTGTYHLGYRFIEMASLVSRQVDLLRWVQPYLQRLSEACGETVDLAVLDGAQVTYLQVVESSQRVKIAAAVGQRLPAHCTASGKAFMAFLPDDQVQGILDAGLSCYTDRTRITLSELSEDLCLARERGYALAMGEYETDIHAVAAPILDAAGYPLAAIAIVGPSYRMPRERMPALGRLAQEMTETIRREVGTVPLATFLPRTKT